MVEQGIGDQIKHFSAINIFKQKFPNLIIETSEKTYPLLKAAFDDIEVRISTMDPDLTTKIEDFDYHLPSASMFFHIVGENEENFREEEFFLLERYLIPDQQRKEYWHRKLQLLISQRLGFAGPVKITIPEDVIIQHLKWRGFRYARF